MFSQCNVPARFISIYTIFQKNCGRGESLGTETCLKIVVGETKAMFAVKYICSNKVFFVSVRLDWDHKTVTKLR